LGKTRATKRKRRKESIEVTDDMRTKVRKALTDQWQKTSDISEKAGLTNKETRAVLMESGDWERKPVRGPWPVAKKA
jgi:hypothetical protein